jgi:ketosteroid isomerase-like protein
MSSSVDLAIRQRRAAFNRALAERDLAAIGTILAPDVVMVTGTDSAILSGRKAQLLAWKREFAASEGTLYTRTPESVLASPVEPIALEQGRWQGVSIADGREMASGSYVAKWRLGGVGSHSSWTIEAEIYLTLA